MASSNGNILRVTGPLWGKFTSHRRIPLTKPMTRNFDVFCDVRLSKRWSEQSKRRWFETPSHMLRYHSNSEKGGSDVWGFLYISSSGSANAQLPGCFHPWTFSLNIGLTMFPLDSFVSCLHSLLGYSTGEVQSFATDCPCGVWCRGLTTCPQYVGPLFGNLV